MAYLQIKWLIIASVLIALACVSFRQTDGALVRKVIRSSFAPESTLPLSQAVWVGDTIYVAGQLGMTVDGVLLTGIVNQTRQALQNIWHILREADSGFENIVKTTVLLADINDSAVMSEVYREFFPNNKTYPARAAYQVGRLPMDALVEIEAIAISGEIVDV